MPRFGETMDQPTRPEPSPKDPVEGRCEEPERKRPPYKQPEPDPFPGYGEPPPEALRESAPNVTRQEWDSTGKTVP